MNVTVSLRELLRQEQARVKFGVLTKRLTNAIATRKALGSYYHQYINFTAYVATQAIHAADLLGKMTNDGLQESSQESSQAPSETGTAPATGPASGAQTSTSGNIAGVYTRGDQSSTSGTRNSILNLQRIVTYVPGEHGLTDGELLVYMPALARLSFVKQDLMKPSQVKFKISCEHPVTQRQVSNINWLLSAIRMKRLQTEQPRRHVYCLVTWNSTAGSPKTFEARKSALLETRFVKTRTVDIMWMMWKQLLVQAIAAMQWKE